MSLVAYSACGSSDEKFTPLPERGDSGEGGAAGHEAMGQAGEISQGGSAPNQPGAAGQAGTPSIGDAGAAGLGGSSGGETQGGAAGLPAGGADAAGAGPAGAAGAGGMGGEGGSGEPSPKIVFVSSVAYTGNLGGLDGADDKCTALASAANLPGTFRAWLSDSTGSPSTRFTRPTVDYVLADHTTVFAHGWTDLTSTSAKPPLNLNEQGGPPPTSDTTCAGLNGGYAVWVSTNGDGTPAPNVDIGDHSCSNWSSTAQETTTVGLGSPVAGNSWLGFCSSGVPSCAKSAPIFCFEQ
jgi:hypothetical protein